ncbi:10257_t:CDS:2 [Ambispora leptoticha]|uniref:10257_t:CDS:1 n=1 Tax=Ambispora leptoticha TaxID=144679 RepID=A0A9N9CGJ9_9GLOM|nr:10257_t:CDS:2 [Ambispora leptoticha]
MATPTLWILPEGHKSPFKYSKEYIQADSDLVDLRSSLCQHQKFLKDVEPSNIEFFSYDNRNESLSEGMLLKDLTTTATTPLIIRYPVSNSNVVVRCNLSTKWFRCDFPHSSGLWYLIRASCQEKFENMPPDVPYYFIYNEQKDNKASGEKLIKTEYQLNMAVSEIEPDEKNKREIHFSIRIEGRKAYGDWELAEVLQQFLKRQGSSLANIGQFNIAELPNQDPSISSDALQAFIKDLEQKRDNFRVVNANEMTCREFISTFMNSAVTHVRSEENELQLKAEEWLSGSRGYGPVVYSVNLGEIVVLVEEAKKENFEKGVAQNIVQMHSAIEALNRKRKIDETESENVPIIMYGIVTNAIEWYFLRWAGSLKDAIIEFSGPCTCDFYDNLKNAKNIVGYIISILQSQVRGLKNSAERRTIKRRRAKPSVSRSGSVMDES